MTGRYMRTPDFFIDGGGAKRCCLVLGCILAAHCTLGCGVPERKGAAPAASVKGTIRMDGKAIPSGEIHFSQTGYPPRVLEIKNGNFAGEAPVGKNQVEVFIYVEGPPSERYPGVSTKKNIAPEKYWGPNTTLHATVNSGEANEMKFLLTSR